MAALEALDAGGLRSAIAWGGGLGRGGVDGARDSVDAVEGTGENECVVGGKVLEARVESAVVD